MEAFQASLTREDRKSGFQLRVPRYTIGRIGIKACFVCPVQPSKQVCKCLDSVRTCVHKLWHRISAQYLLAPTSSYWETVLYLL